MSVESHVEFLLHTIDEACKEWQEKFQTTNAELLQSIRQILNISTEYLTELSKTTSNYAQDYQDQLSIERIVSKLKQMKNSLNNLWPTNINSFTRDIFDVDSYHIEAIEYFDPVLFYPSVPFLMKLCQWSVHRTDGTIPCRYFLEKSHLPGGMPFYVFGKTFVNGHSQLKSYGSNMPNYYEMKTHLISDLTDQNSQPLITTTIMPSYQP